MNSQILRCPLLRGLTLLGSLLVIIGLVAGVHAQRRRPEEPNHLLLGNPSKAKGNTRNPDNFLIVKPQFSLSYNNARGGANWVSWHLEKADIGMIDRANFQADTDLPSGFFVAQYADYARTGFDSGHLCNSKDRTNTTIDNAATFNMTNMLPQAPSLNRGPWKALEIYERSLAIKGFEMYIIAGAFGSGGDGLLYKNKKPFKKVRADSIAQGKISVPKMFWKVMIIIPNGKDDLHRIDGTARAIAVCMPNSQKVLGVNWRNFITAIDNVEAATSFDFFSNLPDRVQTAIESQRDAQARGALNSSPCSADH